MAINTVSFDHADPSIFTGTDLSDLRAGRGKRGLRHFPTAMDGG